MSGFQNVLLLRKQNTFVPLKKIYDTSNNNINNNSQSTKLWTVVNKHKKVSRPSFYFILSGEMVLKLLLTRIKICISISMSR